MKDGYSKCFICGKRLFFETERQRGICKACFRKEWEITE